MKLLPQTRSTYINLGGIIIGKQNIPLVQEGDAMFHVANFEAPDEVATNIDMMNDDIAKKLEEISLED